LGPSDFRGGIAVGTLYGIDHELLPRAKVRIDVLPDDGALAGDLEEPAKPSWAAVSIAKPDMFAPKIADAPLDRPAE
jgi:hypothetical protein